MTKKRLDLEIFNIQTMAQKFGRLALKLFSRRLSLKDIQVEPFVKTTIKKINTIVKQTNLPSRSRHQSLSETPSTDPRRKLTVVPWPHFSAGLPLHRTTRLLHDLAPCASLHVVPWQVLGVHRLGSLEALVDRPDRAHLPAHTTSRTAPGGEEGPRTAWAGGPGRR